MKTKKNLLSSLVVIIILLLSPTKSIFAVESRGSVPVRQSGLAIMCLQPEWCNSTPLPDPACSHESGHRFRLNMPQLSPARQIDDIYLLQCVYVNDDDNNPTTPSDPICTTGNAQLDLDLYCPDEACLSNFEHPANHYKTLIDNYSYQLRYDPAHTDRQYYGVSYKNPTTGEFEPNTPINNSAPKKLSSNPSGVIVHPNYPDVPASLVVEWQNYIPETYDHAWVLAMKESALPENEDSIDDPASGLKEATLTFRAGTTESCISYYYDPYGIVFDAQTLQPLRNASVTLLEKMQTGDFNKSGQVTITNPYTTQVGGLFSFIVSDGDYKLDAVLGDYRMLQPNESNMLNINASRVYENIYYQNQEIKQRGSIQERNVPLLSTNGNHQDLGQVGVYSMESYVNDLGRLVYRGRVTHPFANLSIDRCSTVGSGITTCNFFQSFSHQQGGPGKDGIFEVELDQSRLQPGEFFDPKFSPADFTPEDGIFGFNTLFNRLFSKLKFIKSANAATEDSKLRIEPIPRYLEGYVYDEEGFVVPNGIVNIYTDFVDAPVYRFQANDSGFYRITSDRLPQRAYRIGFENPQSGREELLTTSEYLAINKEFLAVENIDSYKFVTAASNPRRTVTPTYIPEEINMSIRDLVQVNNVESDAEMTVDQSANAETENNSMLLVGAMLLLFIATAGAILGVYVYQKRMTQSEEL